MEKEIGDYKWCSSLEHLGKRNQYFLNKLPDYIQIENWEEYLKENIEILNEKWDKIRSATIKNFPAGSDDFINILTNILKRNFKLIPRGRPFAA